MFNRCSSVCKVVFLFLFSLCHFIILHLYLPVLVYFLQLDTIISLLKVSVDTTQD